MKTQRRIIRCLLFTCTSNKYGLTDASLNAKEITVASSPTSSNRRENGERKGEGKKKKKKKKKPFNVSQLKNDIFPIGEKTVLHIIHRVSRASHGSVVRSLRTIYTIYFTWLYPSQPRTTQETRQPTIDVPFKLVTIIHHMG